ncbi:hypothetical protein JCM10908_005954 [Rhodotorula pacifica]|uniref:uncharacterized protein n=1 Tax=Rhodotorula pacifica TaxID=1495444 RepID=UPI00317B5659
MLDQIAGRPSPSWRRSQVWLVLLFWLSRFYLSPSRGPRILWLRRLNRFLQRKYTPWQIILATCTLFYAVRHGDVLLGLQAPEPLARLYSSDFYRATWIVTALDAGFATAMSIRWKWLRDIASLAFSGYYLLFANDADEKLRKFRAFCTVEMLRITWEKQGNPYIRFFTRRDRPRINIRKKLFLPRPKGSKYSKPLTLHLFFAGTEAELEASNELVMDIPGGGFICMNPLHHEERLLRWAIRTKRVVISFDYGKAPEYPYPFAIDEMYDAYMLLHQTKGRCIGMNRNGEKDLKVLLTGDSAGANIATAMVVKIFEMRTPAIGKPASNSSTIDANSLPLPVALNFAYPALSFHFTSWMPSSDLRVLRSESKSDIASLLLRQKDHLEHRSPLAVVEDVEPARGKRPNFTRRRTTSSGGGGWPWTGASGKNKEKTLTGSKSFSTLTLGGRRASLAGILGGDLSTTSTTSRAEGGEQGEAATTGAESDGSSPDECDKALEDRVLWWDEADQPATPWSSASKSTQDELKRKVKEDEALVMGKEDGAGAAGKEVGEAKAVARRKKESAKEMLAETRLAMTSRTAFFNDRIISPSMCRAMALLYVGPRNAPDLHSDYHLSPIFTPSHLLAQFPPVYMSCGERDPLVDDTVIFAGKLREAKEARKMDILAREARHGDGLRMSTSGRKRDPFVDETEDDWVRTSIIAGWSHGYLQMVSLLPAAEKVIAMHADWIVEAFETAAEKELNNQQQQLRLAAPARSSSSTRTPTRTPASTGAATRPEHLTTNGILPDMQPINVIPPTPVITDSTALAPSATPSPQKDTLAVHSASALSDGEQEDDILTFTPKRRRGSSNASRSSRSGGASPPTQPYKSSPPLLSPGADETIEVLDECVPAMGGLHLVTPAERALRDELLPGGQQSHLALNSAPASRPTTPGRRSASAQPGATSGSSTATRTSRPERTLSLSPPPAPSPRTGRSPSASALPQPQGAIFIDARDLMRRRKEDVVFGIVSGAGSRTSSPPPRKAGDGERGGAEEKEGARFDRRRTVE